MDDRSSPVAELLENVSSALAARRARLLERVQRIELAVEGYRRAVEAQIVREFAKEHSLKLPSPPALPPERAAEILKALVDALPECAARIEAETTAPAGSATASTAGASAGAVAPPASTSGSAPPGSTAAAPRMAEVDGGPASTHPLLAARVKHGRIVVIGALSGRDRGSTFPAELADHVEWIDTERDGAHAIGNLPQRVRQGRVAAVVILDRAVQHRHTEPVVAQAREQGVPIAFAGQGGKASLTRALAQIEAALQQHSE